MRRLSKSGRNMRGFLAKVSEKDLEHIAKETEYQSAIIAKTCGVRLRQSQRIFLRRFKMSPTEWCRHLRARLALLLIRQGLSSREIAKELHFANTSHFCHEFKKVHGVLPRVFRASTCTRARRRGIALSNIPISRLLEDFFHSLTLS